MRNVAMKVGLVVLGMKIVWVAFKKNKEIPLTLLPTNSLQGQLVSFKDTNLVKNDKSSHSLSHKMFRYGKTISMLFPGYSSHATPVSINNKIHCIIYYIPVSFKFYRIM